MPNLDPVPTVAIANPDGGPMLINESDFDPDKHSLWTEPDSEPNTEPNADPGSEPKRKRRAKQEASAPANDESQDGTDETTGAE